MEPNIPGSPGRSSSSRETVEDHGNRVDTGHRAGAVRTAAGADEGGPPESVQHRRLLYVTLPGCWGALVFACLSFTPSLLPRGGLLQGLLGECF
ncbi:hypothetical protein FXW78_46480 [Rhodococcus opacus]|nr:hypothetical protein [Rhodococcus opacus]